MSCGEPLQEGAAFCSTCGAPARLTLELGTTGEPDPGSGWGEVLQRLRRATLGEFQIGPELGRGGMAAVFLAHEISLDRKVAIKVMSPALLMDEGSADRFRREAITIAHLNHPNIVSVHSVRQAEGLHFFVMRYIRGRSLEHVIEQAGKLPIPIVRSILSQVGSALTYAHRSGVVHRDIKPANILIDEDGNAFVTDFGIAKVADQPSETHPGALVGTPAYMSPEQCSGAEVSGSSDQYSLGAVAYEMLTGASPFSGSTFTVIQGHLEHAPPPIRDSCGECPPELENAVLRMLEKNPTARWPSIAQANAALGAIPLGEDDPMMAQLCSLASPDGTPSLTGKFMPAGPRIGPSSPRPKVVPGLVRTISILPPPAALETGDSFNLVAMVRGEHGVPLPGRSVQWATDTPEVLRVNGNGGVATAVAPGTAGLTATCEGVRARVQVQIAPPMADEADVEQDVRVAAVQISAPPKSIKAGDSFVLTATPVDYRGGLLLGRPVQWSTSDVTVAVVTASGWVAALGQGSVVLNATCDGATGSVEITVEAAAPVRRAGPTPKRERPPASKPGTFPGVAASSQAAEEQRVVRRRRPHSREHRFLVLSLGVLLLSAVLWLSGALRALLPHHPQSKDMVASFSASHPVTDQPIAPILRGGAASVAVIRLPRRSLRPGASTRLLAEVRDQSGRVLPGSTATWLSRDSAVARIDPKSGWLQAMGPGHAWVVAASGERRDSARIVVRPPRAEPAVASVSITPHDSLSVGDTVTLAAAVLDEHGATLPEPRIAWTSSEPRVVAIDPLTGQAQGIAPGTATVTASSGSKLASSQLRVVATEPALDTLTVQAYGSEPEPELGPSEEPQGTVVDPAVTFRESRSAERARLEAALRTGLQHCYDALRSKDVARVAQLYRPTSKSDQDKLNKLTSILENEEWSAVIGERVDGARQLGATNAAAEFSFQMVWKDAFGGRLTSRPAFRAEFTRNGDAWELSSCRIIGSPKL
jgi:serine/threonine protein kinase